MRTTAPGQSALLLLDIIDILNERAVAYAIIGAFAASFYGVVRASLDADAVISIQTAQDAIDLCQDVLVKNFVVDHRRGDRDDPIAAVINIQDRFHNRVDLLIGIHGMTQELFGRVQTAPFMGSLIKIVGLEDFIALKIFAGSPKDTQDIIGTLKVSGQKIDLNLLKQLTSSYGADGLQKLEIILKEHPLGKF
jgi:predicted nucleotidyltransferase